MSVSSITSAFSNYAQKVTGGSSAGGSQAATAGALQEATETKAQTAKEAKNGDRVAVRKLHQLQQKEDQQQAQTESAPATEPGKGDQVDTKA